MIDKKKKDWKVLSAPFTKKEMEIIEKYMVKNNLNESQLVKLSIAILVGIQPTVKKLIDIPKGQEFADYMEKKIEEWLQSLMENDQKFKQLVLEYAKDVQSQGKKIDWTDFLGNLKPFIEHNPIGRPKSKPEKKYIK